VAGLNAKGAKMQTTAGVLAVRVMAVLAAATLLGSIIWSTFESDISAGMAHLLADRWGITTLIDIYVGGIFVALWAWLRLRAIGPWLLVVLGLIFLGHLTTIVLLAVMSFRARRFAEIFVPPAMLKTPAP